MAVSKLYQIYGLIYMILKGLRTFAAILEASSIVYYIPLLNLQHRKHIPCKFTTINRPNILCKVYWNSHKSCTFRICKYNPGHG